MPNTNTSQAYVLNFQSIGINEIEKVLTTIQDIEDAIKDINKVRVTTDLGSKQYQDLSKSLAEVSNFRKGIIAQQKQLEKALSEPATLATGSYRQLNAELISLKNRYKDLSEVERNGTFGKQTQLQIQSLDKQLKTIDASIGQFQRNVGNYRDAFLGVVSNVSPQLGSVLTAFDGIVTGSLGTAAAIGGITVALAGLGKALEINARISDLKSDVVKTANLTPEEIDRLVESLKQLDTRTSLDGLLKIAAVGGQLGVSGEQNILKFTSAIDKLNVALGDEFQGGAEAITNDIGRLSNVLFGTETNGEKLSDNLLSIGNALNVLGANGSATSPVIADFANRIGGVGKALGLTNGQILGLSSTLQELNVSAERGGTAIGRILTSITGDRANVAKVLNLDLKEFTNLLNTDLNGAFIKVIDKVSKLGKNSTELSDILKVLKIDGQGELEVFLKLSQNQELLTQRTGEATEALKSQSSITNEFNVKNDNLAGSIEKLKNSISNGFVNSGLEKGFTNLINLITPLLDGIYSLTNGLLNAIGAATGLGAVFNVYNGILADTADQNDKVNKLAAEYNATQTKNNKAVEDSFKVLTSEKATLEDKRKVIADLQKLAPETLKGYDLEKLSVQELTGVQKLLTAELKEQGKVKLLKETAGITLDFQAARTQLLKLQQLRGELSGDTVDDFGNSRASNLDAQIEQAERRVNEIGAILKNANAQIDSFDRKIVTPNLTGTTDFGSANLGDTKTNAKAAREAKRQANELEKFLKDLSKIQLTEAEKNGNALQKLQDEQARTRIQGIEDDQTRETLIETNRFNAETEKLKQLGVERENEILKQAAELQQKLKDSDNLTKGDKERIESEITKLKLNANDIRLQIEQQANAQIELESVEHERKLTEIKDKYAKKANEDLLKRQKENFDLKKSQLDTEFKQIDLASAQRQSNFKGTPEQVEANKASEKIKSDQQKLDALRLKLASANKLNEAASFAGLDADFSTKDLQTFVDESLVLERQITEGKEAEKKKREKADDEETAKRKKNLKEIQVAALDGAKLISDGLFKIQNDRLDTEINNELSAVEKKYNAEIEAATNNKQEQERLQKELEEKKREIEIRGIKERAQQNKSQALIDGALSVLKTFATFGFSPAGVIAAALAGVATGVQIAVINSESEKQISALKAEQGAIIENPNYQQGRDIQGRRHSQNGELNYINGKWIEAEQGERFDRDEYGNAYIFSRSKTSQYRAALDRVSGRTFEGKGSILRGIMKAEQGAFLPKSLPVSADNVSRKDLNISVSFSDSQIDLIAERLAQRTGASVYGATVAAGQENNRRVERENITLNNAIL